MIRVFFVMIHDKTITIQDKNLTNRDLFCSLDDPHCGFPSRAPPGSPAPTVVPGAASGIHDVLLVLLVVLSLFCRCCYVCDIFLLLTPVGKVTMQVNPSRRCVSAS